MRRLLSFASFFSVVLVALSVFMWKRGAHTTDWLRVSVRDRSAVFACSRDHVGVALITDTNGWSTRDDRWIRYKHLEPTDLREQFHSNVAGFAYRSDGGAHLVLAPLWAVAALGVTPPLLWLMRPRRPAKGFPMTASPPAAAA